MIKMSWKDEIKKDEKPDVPKINVRTKGKWVEEVKDDEGYKFTGKRNDPKVNEFLKEILDMMVVIYDYGVDAKDEYFKSIMDKIEEGVK